MRPLMAFQAAQPQLLSSNSHICSAQSSPFFHLGDIAAVICAEYGGIRSLHGSSAA